MGEKTMKMKIILFSLLVILMTLPSYADNLLHNPPTSSWTGRKTLTWLDSKNEVRYVDVYVPKSYKKQKNGVPVVMWFMGSRMNVRKDYHYLGMCYEDCGIAPYAEKNNFILVVIDQKHIDGKGWSMLEGDDRDETLTLDVLAYLKTRLPVDASRVYLWGISAGGKLSQYLAAKHSDLFAAVVSFSGVFDDHSVQMWHNFCDCIKNSARKFPIQHWQTAGDYESLIKYMPYMIKLFRENGHPVEYVWLDNMPERRLKHEWYADLYNQKMWDWCSKYSVVDGKTVVEKQK
jgi:poly(3-hydroxybutyrate) depolymerase